MIIDCHGHYTTEPEQLTEYRKAQLAGLDADPSFMPTRADLKITDDEIRERLEPAQLKLQRERGTDLTIFSPRAWTARISAAASRGVRTRTVNSRGRAVVAYNTETSATASSTVPYSCAASRTSVAPDAIA